MNKTKNANKKTKKVYIENEKLQFNPKATTDEDYIEEEDGFENYMKITQVYTSKSVFLTFSWNGIQFLDKWELQRKVDIDHVNKIANSMYAHYKIHKEFISYDPVHLAKKEGDDKYYVLDGQHRLEAYKYFCELNKYPIQQIPAILWYAKNDEEFIDLFHKINSRLTIDKLKLAQMKILEIMNELEIKYSADLWGIYRPHLNKTLFADKLRETDAIHKLSTEEIVAKLNEINKSIRLLPRSLRVKNNKPSTASHTTAENMDFFLGLDKEMTWMEKL